MVSRAAMVQNTQLTAKSNIMADIMALVQLRLPVRFEMVDRSVVRSFLLLMLRIYRASSTLLHRESRMASSITLLQSSMVVANAAWLDPTVEWLVIQCMTKL